MVVTPVTLGPHLRAWAQAGLIHILCDGPVVLPEAGRSLAMPSAPAPTAGPAPHFVASAALSSALPVNSVPTSVHGGAGHTNRAAVPETAVRHEGPATHGADASKQPAGSAPTLPSCAGVPANAVSWPEPWASWAVKSTPAPVLWTYHELGTDVTGVGRSTERSSFFKNMITELRLPRGSSVFWPCAMPAQEVDVAYASPGDCDGGLRANGPIFTAGVERFNPRVMVVFGERALDDMGLAGACGVFRQVIVGGRLLVLLPSIEELLDGAAHRSSAVSLLRGVFAPLSLE